MALELIWKFVIEISLRIINLILLTTYMMTLVRISQKGGTKLRGILAH